MNATDSQNLTTNLAQDCRFPQSENPNISIFGDVLSQLTAKLFSDGRDVDSPITTALELVLS